MRNGIGFGVKSNAKLKGRELTCSAILRRRSVCTYQGVRFVMIRVDNRETPMNGVTTDYRSLKIYTRDCISQYICSAVREIR